jgi:alkylation response protein AidB-like acyl-CoA dehydrogenase
MLTQIMAAREMTNLCLRKRIANEDATKEISLTKLFCTRMSRFVADQCIQLHGGMGYMKENVAGRAFVDTRLWSIRGGADEVMVQSVAKMIGL